MPLIDDDEAQPYGYSPTALPKAYKATPDESIALSGPKPTTSEMWGAAMRRENDMLAAFRAIDSANNFGDVDRSHNPYDSIKGTELEPYLKYFAGSRNQTETDHISRRIREEMKDRKILAMSGWGGLGAELVASIVSPTTIMPGGAVVKGGRAGLAAGKSALSVGAANVVATGVQEGVLQSTQYTRTALETALALGGSAVLGGALGGVMSGYGSRSLAKIAKQARELGVENELNRATEAGVNRAAADLSAASTAKPDLELKGALGLEKALSFQDPVLRAANSPSMATREIMAEMADSVLYTTRNADGITTAPRGGSLEARLKTHGVALEARAVKAVNDLWMEHRFGQKVSTPGLRDMIQGRPPGTLSAREFRLEVGKAMARGDTHEIPEVAKAAQAMRAELIDPLANRAIMYGLLDAEVVGRMRPKGTPTASPAGGIAEAAPPPKPVSSSVDAPDIDPAQAAIVKNLLSDLSELTGREMAPDQMEIMARDLAGDPDFLRRLSEVVRGGPPDFAVQAAETPLTSRSWTDVYESIEDGKTVTIDNNVLDEMEAIVEELQPTLPKGLADLPKYIVTHIDPDAEGMAVATFRRAGSDEIKEVDIPIETLGSIRAFHWDGNVFFLKSGFGNHFGGIGDDVGRELTGHLWHEQAHALFHRLDNGETGLSDGLRALVGHAEDLRVMEGDFKTFLQATNNTEADLAPSGISIREVYEHLHRDEPDRLERVMQEEAVAHMLELRFHGHLTDDLELAPVKDIIDELIGVPPSRVGDGGDIMAAIQRTDIEPVTPGLDMSQAARLKRAREMGFDTDTVVYHGTNRVDGEIGAFDPNAGKFDRGIWFAQDPGVAKDFANGFKGASVEPDGSIYPVHLNKKNYAVVDWPEYLYKRKEERGEARGTPYTSNRGTYDQEDMINQYRGEGYDGVELLRAGEKPGYMRDSAWVVFNPSTIRSVNAAFDPANADSSKLMAAAQMTPRDLANIEPTPAAVMGDLPGRGHRRAIVDNHKAVYEARSAVERHGKMEKSARKDAIVALESGLPVRVPDDALADVVETLQSFKDVIPRGVRLTAVGEVRAIRGRANVEIDIIGNLRSGRTITETIEIDRRTLFGSQAIVSRDGKNVVIFNLAGTAEDVSHALRGQIAKVSAESRLLQGGLGADVRSRLFAHVDALNPLGKTLSRYARERGDIIDPKFEDVTLTEYYGKRYASDPEKEELIKIKAIGHLVEDYASGRMGPETKALIERDLLDTAPGLSYGGRPQISAAIMTLAKRHDAIPLGRLMPWQKHPKKKILAFHGTQSTFDKFDKSRSYDFGVHVGTTGQASNIVKEGSLPIQRFMTRKVIDDAQVIPVVLDVKKPLTVPDMQTWRANDMLKELERRGVSFTEQERRNIEVLARAGDDKGAYPYIEQALDRNGYDSIRYLNAAEGLGWSYIVWKPGKLASATNDGHMMFAAQIARRNDAVLMDEIVPEMTVPHPNRPVLAFHGTNKTFDKFDLSRSEDIGIHFGTAAQANDRVSIRDANDPNRVIPVVIDIKNPMTSNDLGNWSPDALYKTAIRQGVEFPDEAEALFKKIRDSRDDLMPEDWKQANGMVRAALERAGYDGIRYLNQHEGDGWSYIVWNKGSVRSATGGQMMFAAQGPRTSPPPIRAGAISPTDDLGFYSKAVTAAKDLKQAKGTPEQMLSQLKKAGVKQAEIEATGLDDFVDGQKSITRDGIVAFLELQQVPVREVRYGNVRTQEDADLLDQLGVEVGPEFEAARANEGKVEEAIWSSYSLDPSNPTYRETVLHLPEQGDFDGLDARQGPLIDERHALEVEFGSNLENATPDGLARHAAITEELEKIRQEMNRARNANFRKGHFSEPNAISHLRTSMQPDAEGKQNFVINELQSDWGQKIRNVGGVRDELKTAELKKQYADLSKQYANAKVDIRQNKITTEEFERIESDQRRVYAELRTAEESAPGHPLVNTTDQWVNTSLRRALRQAVEDGADYIAISSGETVDSFGMGAPLEGLKYAYNEMYPKKLRDIIKKIDKDAAKVELIDGLNSHDKAHNVGVKPGPGAGNSADRAAFRRFPITEKLRKAILDKGQPLFAAGPKSPLLTEIRRLGGIKDVTGDLKAMDAHKSRGIVSDKGLDPDRMRESLEQGGFIKPNDLGGTGEATSTIDDLYEAVREALSRVDDKALGSEEYRHQILTRASEIYEEAFDEPLNLSSTQEKQLFDLVIKQGKQIDDALEKMGTATEDELAEIAAGPRPGPDQQTRAGRMQTEMEKRAREAGYDDSEPPFSKEVGNEVWDDGGQSYIMRVYKKEMIRAKRAQFKSIIQDYLWGGRNRAEAVLNRIQRQVAEGKLDAAKAQKDIDDLNDFVRLDESDLGDLADQIILHILNTKDGRVNFDLPAGVRGPLKARTLRIKDTFEAQAGKFEDFLERDVNRLARLYNRTMTPQVELTRMFGSLDMKDQIAKITDDYTTRLLPLAKTEAERTKLNRQMEIDIRDITAQAYRAQGLYGMPDDPLAWTPRAAAAAKNFSYITKLGGMTVSAVPDLMRAMMVRGIGPFVQDGLAPLLHGLKNFKAAGREIEDAGTALEIVMPRGHAIADIMDDYGRHSSVERGLGWAADNFGYLSLMNQWNGTLKKWAGSIIMNNVLKATRRLAKGTATPKDIEKLAKFGLDDFDARIVAEQFDKHGGVEGGVYLANTRDWDLTDPNVVNAMESFRAGLATEVDATIVTPGMDKPLWISTWQGSFFGQFKSFGIASIHRTLLLGLQQKEAGALLGATMMIGLGMVSETLKAAANDKPLPQNDAQWLAAGIDRSGLLGYFMEVNNMTERMTLGHVGVSAVTGKQLSRFASRNTLGSFIGPSAGTLADITGALQGLTAALTEKEHVRESDIAALRRLIPLQNLFYLAYIFQKLEQAVGDGIGVKRTGKRRMKLSEAPAAQNENAPVRVASASPEPQAPASTQAPRNAGSSSGSTIPGAKQQRTPNKPRSGGARGAGRIPSVA